MQSVKSLRISGILAGLLLFCGVSPALVQQPVVDAIRAC